MITTHVFIDANILLQLFGYSPQELQEARKLVALVKSGNIVLYVTSQVRNEFARNRPRVLSELLKPLGERSISTHVPKVASSLNAAREFVEAAKAANRAHSVLVKEIRSMAVASTLEADTIIEELFQAATPLSSEHHTDAAHKRLLCGNPPGKGGKIGDEVNWETLLADVPVGLVLHIVAADGDYVCPLSGELHPFLAEEWRNSHKAGVSLHRSLEDFTKAHYPDVKLPTDVPVFNAIHALGASASFSRTHNVVARLEKFDYFTLEQARLLLGLALENSQVRAIASDPDVAALLKRVIDAHRDSLDAGLVSALEQNMYRPQVDFAVNLDEIIMKLGQGSSVRLDSADEERV